MNRMLFFSIDELVILGFLDEYPVLNYPPIGALDSATEVGPSFIANFLEQIADPL